MREDGSAHPDHDHDPGPSKLGMALFAVAAIVVGWVLAGRPCWQL